MTSLFAAPFLATPLFALGMLAIGLGIIPLNDAMFKLMSADLSLGQLIGGRALLVLGVLAVFTRALSSLFTLPPAVIGLFFGRAMCHAVAMILFFVSLGSLPLATVLSIFFAAPILSTILSVPVLGETIGLHRISAVSVGMVGVLLIVRPGTIDFQPETLLVVLAAFFYAVFNILTRRFRRFGNLTAMVAAQHMCSVGTGGLLILISLIWPTDPSGNVTMDFLLRAPQWMTLTQGGYLLFCSFAVLFLSLASSHAYRTVEASAIAPFEYVAIPFGVLWGIIIWQDWPDMMAWMGMGLIIAGGLYTVYRESR